MIIEFFILILKISKLFKILILILIKVNNNKFISFKGDLWPNKPNLLKFKSIKKLLKSKNLKLNILIYNICNICFIID